MSLLGTFRQQVGEVMDYYIDYTDWFSTRSDAPGQLNVGEVAGMSLVGFALDTDTKRARIVLDSTASVDGDEAQITVWLTTSSGIIKEDDFRVLVREV